MAIPLPRRRDNPVGRPNIQVPTRDNIKRQNVSQDPGARGGPSAIPAGAFGGGEGVTALGAGIQQYAAAESQQLQRELNRSDYINTEIEKGNLSNELERAAGQFDPVSGSYTNPDGTVDNDGMVRLTQEWEKITQNRVEVMQKNMAVSQQASDEFSQQAELVKQNVFAKVQQRTSEARTEQFKLSLQAQLVQVATDRASASDVVNLIRTNKAIANGFISSLNTKARNEALATASAGLLKHAVRKFTLGGQFRQAKNRLEDIIKALGEQNISTTGWTAKSINETFLYIDEEQQKFNNTQSSAQSTDRIRNAEAVDRLFSNLPVKERQAMKRRIMEGGTTTSGTDKMKEVEAVPILFPFLSKEEQQALQLAIFNGSLGTYRNLKITTDYYKQLEESQNGKLTPDQEKRRDEELTKIRSGLSPKASTAYEQDEIRKKDVHKHYKELKEKQGGALTADQEENYDNELRQLRSKTPTIQPDAFTQKQNVAVEWLDSQLKLWKNSPAGKKQGISQEQYDRIMAKVKTGVDLPVDEIKTDNSFHRLVSDLVDSHFGADVKGPNAKQPQPGYEEFSTRFKSAVVQAYITGEYSNGLSVGKARNLFDIIHHIGKMSEFAGKGPKLPTPEVLFDNRVGIKLTGTKQGLQMTILDQPFIGNLTGMDESYQKESIENALEEATAIVNSNHFKDRLITAGLKTGIDYRKATGIWSGLRDTVASFSQIIGAEAEDPRVTQSRLLYSLVARDFIRFVSLSPRFAVKEQELLRDLFPSSGVLNSPRQTKSRLSLFRNLLKKKIGDLRATAVSTEATREEAIESAKVWASTIRNINLLMPEAPRVSTLADIKKLSPVDAYDYIHSEILGDSNRPVSRSDMNDYKEQLIKEHGKKEGTARFKLLDQKLIDRQKEILKRNTP